MPHGARTTLAALVLLLGVGGAGAEPTAGTTWTDPPIHKPAAEAPDRKAAAPAPAASQPASQAASPAASSMPAAAAEARPTRAARSDTRRATRKTAARPAPARTAEHRAPSKRLADSARRSRSAAAAARIAGPRIALAPPPPPEGSMRFRPYGRPYGYGPGYGPGYADERFDRLSSAEAAGYLVVRRRTVLFPDGRALRVYRPDDGEPF
ncbi:hypothetical protein [Methylobacterium sp. SI9]|uniref:hypothetical protein n=1 Tax=Methylobacterium guangdongense TaxID=3138811 RepID=UPI00313C79DC